MGVVLTAWALVWRVVPTDPVKVELIKAATIRRIEATQAVSPADNGITLLPPDPAILARYKAMSQYDMGTRQATLQAIRGAPASDRALAEEGLPRLLTAIRKPVFALPEDWRKGHSGTGDGIVALRSMAQTLHVIGVERELSGRRSDALDLYLAAEELGSKVGASGPLITRMCAVSMQIVPLDDLLTLLASDTLPARDAREALRRLQALPGRREDFLDGMDEEFVLSLVGIDQLAGNNPQAVNAPGGSPLNTSPAGGISPWWLARERMFFENGYLRWRPAIQSLDVRQCTALNSPPSGLLQGLRQGFLFGIMWPNVARAMTVWKCLHARLDAARLLAAIRLYRLDQGACPPKLQALVPRYLPAVPVVDPNPRTEFEYRQVGRSYELVGTSDLFSDTGLARRLVFHHP